MPNKTRPLINGDWIGSCNETLDNKCQCKRPASWVVLNEDGSDSPFQMCNRCKVLADAGVTNAPILPIEGTGTVQIQVPFVNPQTPEEVEADLAVLNGETKSEPNSTTNTSAATATSSVTGTTPSSATTSS